jgi:alkanesulfonate monooxygenase SsuD/methylene tetrahydromethanopterin reductase-like flavin-dependent oxidoreductase (luciferase family)
MTSLTPPAFRRRRAGQRERPTLRQLLHSLAGARGHLTLAGTPDGIADLIEDWFTSGAADGFNAMAPILATQFLLFIEHVLPILRRRGLFRTEYRATTLRGHLGLKRPTNCYFPQTAPTG